MGVPEVTWDKGDMVRAGDYIFSIEKEKKFIICEHNFLCNLKNKVGSKESRIC